MFFSVCFTRTLSSGTSSTLKAASPSLRNGFRTTWRWWPASSSGLHCCRLDGETVTALQLMANLHLNVENLFFCLLDFRHLFSTEPRERHRSRERKLVGDFCRVRFAVLFFWMGRCHRQARFSRYFSHAKWHTKRKNTFLFFPLWFFLASSACMSRKVITSVPWSQKIRCVAFVDTDSRPYGFHLSSWVKCLIEAMNGMSLDEKVTAGELSCCTVIMY